MTAETMALPRTTASEVPPRSRRYRRESLLAFVSRWCVVIALSVIFMAPVVFIALTAVMSNDLVAVHLRLRAVARSAVPIEMSNTLPGSGTMGVTSLRLVLERRNSSSARVALTPPKAFR